MLQLVDLIVVSCRLFSLAASLRSCRLHAAAAVVGLIEMFWGDILSFGLKPGGGREQAAAPLEWRPMATTSYCNYTN